MRSKMDANEYKDYLLGIVFYKYLSDSFLIKVYDLLYDEKPSTLKEALEAVSYTHLDSLWYSGSTRSDSGCSFCERGVRCRKEDGTLSLIHILQTS